MQHSSGFAQLLEIVFDSLFTSIPSQILGISIVLLYIM